MNNANQLEREIARQLEIANSFARADAKVEERKATRQAAALVRKQAKEHVQAMLSKSAVKHQTQSGEKQTKLQPEQLAKQFDDQMTKVNELLVSLGGKPIIKAVKTTVSVEVTTSSTTDTLSVDEEHYRTTLITNMIQLIHTKRKPV